MGRISTWRRSNFLFYLAETVISPKGRRGASALRQIISNY
jgi:hypothetical protein